MARLTTYFASLVAVVIALSATLAAGVEASQPDASREVSRLPIVEHRAEIDFGEEIELHAEIETGALVTVEARAIYRPHGPSRISTYAYADARVSSAFDKLTVQFTIPTGGATYYPPGTEFDVHFELLDSEGVTHSTTPFTVEYLDPRIDWRRVSNGPVTAIYHGISDNLARDLVDHAVTVLPSITATIGVDDPPSIKAVLFNSVKEATPYFPPVSKTATDRQFFAGFAMSEFGLFVMAAPSRGIFVHEMTHLVVAESEKSPLGHDAPSWLNEGLAVYFQNEGDDRSLEHRLASPARGGRLLPLKNMNRVPGRRNEIGVFYPQAGHFVGYLIDTYGRERIGALLANLDSGQEISDAFHSTYGESLYDVENTWRSTLGANALPTPDSARSQLPPPITTQLPLLQPPVDTVKSSTLEPPADIVKSGNPEPTAMPAPTSAPPGEPGSYVLPATDVRQDDASGQLSAIVVIAVLLTALAALSGAFVLARRKAQRRQAQGP